MMISPRRTSPRTWLVKAFSVAAAALATCALAAVHREARAESPRAEVRFNRDIRPILSENCFACHGPDEKHREAALRLDKREAAIDEAGVIVPGKSAESVLLERIRHPNVKRRMPPPKSGKTLKPEQVQLIKRWIDQGAKYEGHWAFITPTQPPLPKVKNAAWSKNEIDYFILARLEREGLTPNPEANRRDLIRRVTFDLTGLPPTPAEVKAFLEDKSPDAYEKLVDRLLTSPHYGEHRARYWLDAVRYGDTHGLHLDNYREMWPYRDWVIEAYNKNKPYDRFTVEQIAGDLLPEPTRRQLVASGYNRNHVTTSEGGSITEEVYVRNVVDRVSTTATVFMGLTAGCAVCHDHKFDPLKQKEFYQLFAFFNSIDGPALDGNKKDPAPVIRVPTEEQEKKVAKLRANVAKTNQRLQARAAAAGPDFAKWLAKAEANVKEMAEVKAGLIAHYPLDEAAGKLVPNAAGGPAGQVHGKPAWKPGKLGNGFTTDGSRFLDLGSAGDFERTQAFSYGGWVKWNGAGGGGAVLARMDDANAHRGYDLYVAGGKIAAHLIHHWPDNTLKVTTKGKAIKPNEWAHLFVTHDGSGKASGLKVYVNGKEQPIVVNFDKLTDTIRTPTSLRIGRRSAGSHFRGIVDEVRLYDRLLSAQEIVTLAGADPVAPILATPAEKRAPEQVETLRNHYLTQHDTEYRKLRDELTKLENTVKAVEGAMPTTLVMKERPQPREAFVLVRGEYNKKGDKVERGTPAFLPPMPEGAPKDRLGFAKWLVDPSHPLTARVAVNRFWQQLFGTGIVRTAEDFGSQGEWPSHPDLLDWMATQFIADKWNVKETIKRMVLSATYRQSAKVRPEVVAKDPENRLLSRGPRFRLDAEMIRDQALAVSGLLVEKVGGPSVKPPQPSGLWEAVGYTRSNTANFKPDAGTKIYRRGVYTFWKRTSPPPQMTTFDAPSREACRVRRERTNTPLQALLLMNERQMVECARCLAQRMMKEGGKTPAQRIAFAFLHCTARKPDPEEAAVLLSAYNDFLKEYRADPEAAKKLIQTGDTSPDANLDASELAAWTMIANTILNLDEVLNK